MFHTMFQLKHRWELPPPDLNVSGSLQDAIYQCAKGEASPDDALMRLLIASCSQEETEKVLGTAIWDALELRNGHIAERLGAVQKLWDGARELAETALEECPESAFP
jgi:hypothetical protein